MTAYILRTIRRMIEKKENENIRRTWKIGRIVQSEKSENRRTEVGKSEESYNRKKSENRRIGRIVQSEKLEHRRKDSEKSENCRTDVLKSEEWYNRNNRIIVEQKSEIRKNRTIGKIGES